MPPAVTTVTSTVPVPTGLVTVMLVALSFVMFAATLPNNTFVALAMFVPVIVTLVPPAAGPVVGLIFVTVGAAT